MFSENLTRITAAKLIGSCGDGKPKLAERTLGSTLHTAWRKAKDRDTWLQVVSTAMLC